MSKHDNDFYGWTQETAELLKQGRFTEVDLDNLIEEVESMGRSERNELVSRLSVLLAHLLKWRYQPDRRGRSWRVTIETQRDEVQEVLADNPSLKPQITDVIARAYRKAVNMAAQQTNFERSDFPATCPWAWEQIIDDEFYPEA